MPQKLLNIVGLHQQVAKIWGLENLSLFIKWVHKTMFFLGQKNMFLSEPYPSLIT